MKQSETVRRACNLAIRRARFDRARLQLPVGYGPPEGRDDGGDTWAIREATRIYTETWIVPILRAIRDGDTATLRFMTAGERGDDPDKEGGES